MSVYIIIMQCMFVVLILSRDACVRERAVKCVGTLTEVIATVIDVNKHFSSLSRTHCALVVKCMLVLALYQCHGQIRKRKKKSSVDSSTHHYTHPDMRVN